MLQINEDALYDRKDLAELFGKSTRTIDRFYAEGLHKRQIRGMNYTFGYEIIEWITKDDKVQQPINKKLVKFRQKIV